MIVLPSPRVRLPVKSPSVFIVGVVVFLVVMPIGVIFSSFFQDASKIWAHFFETILGEILMNTFWLGVGVGGGTLILGVSLAWVTSFCEFPGRRFWEWILMLPLAVPTYVLGFIWIGMMDYSGTVPTFLRNHFKAQTFWIPPIRSGGGVIFVMILAFYPYVYLLARNAFLTQGRSSIEAAKVLGMNDWDIFFRVSLPMARPWIVGGLMLVWMEVLADFGTVSVFNYDTLTTAIYKAWFSLFSLPAAAQLSSLLVIMIFIFLAAENFLRGRKGYAPGAKQHLARKRFVLKREKTFMAWVYLSMILLLAFVMPVLQLGFWVVKAERPDFDGRYFEFFFHTVFLAVLSACLICTVSLGLNYAARRQPGWLIELMIKISTIGYAMPGTVLAVGVYASLVGIDHLLSQAGRALLGIEGGLILTGTIAAMLLAYLVRFLRVAHTPIESAFERITPHIEDAARNMGYHGLELIRKIQMPLIKGGLWTGLILVFVDVMREMPITLMTRPFGWDTLAVKIFEFTSEGEWQMASLPSLFLVITGLIPVLVLASREKGSQS